MMSYDIYHSRLMYVNDEVIMKTGQKLGRKIDKKGNNFPHIPCTMGKLKQKRIPKTTQVRATRPG